MSAIINKPVILEDISSYRTRVKVVFHTHSSNTPLVLMQEVRGFRCGKGIKGPGTCNITLVPNKNYLNYIFSNDYVNLYVDRGDGEGWTRVFFGYVDRISEEYSVDPQGTPNTTYTVACSDFSKAFEQTMIYFNPAISQDRADFDAQWMGVPNIGGLALKTKGLAATGTPPDVILNTIFVLMGASSQFVLPTGMNPTTKNKYRLKRAEFVIGRLQADMLRSVPNGVQVTDFLKKAEAVVNAQISLSSAKSVLNEKNLNKALQDSGLVTEFVDSINGATSDQKQQYIGILASNTIVRSSLLDILDVFSFVEREAMDGYCDSVSIWQQEGSVMSFLTRQCNEVVNELFFDLRPTTDSPLSTDYTREPDEIGGNATPDLPPGIRYVPALVMREYPFSTIESLDLSDVKFSLAGTDGDKLTVGKVPFGAVFSDSPNVKGRHLITVPNINIEDKIQGKGSSTTRILDVAVIEPTEITASSFGRSDHEHFNLMTFLSDGVLGQDSRYYMNDILPIISPIHIARHGLRVKEITSSFARFGADVIPNVIGSTTDATEEQEEDAPEAGTGQVVAPIVGTYKVGSKYGWRGRTDPGPSKPPYNLWIFHHGQDFPAASGTPVVAVADGYVVGVVPSGTPGFTGYGNCIVVQHKEPFQGQPVMSLYAHLVSIDPNILASGNPQSRRDVSAACAKELKPGGKMQKFFVSAGTTLGGVGCTNFADASGRTTEWKFSGNHLHFEIIKRYPARGMGKEGTPPRAPYSSTPPATPDPSTLNSIDPLIFFNAYGVTLGATTDEVPEEDDKDPEDSDIPHQTDKDDDTEDNTAAGTTKPGNLDNSKIRSQIARWALLHDHWYQHNLEYLSGSITMRGAPEIRVGYRLDINDPLRPLSFYVEGVEHSWEFPNTMITTLSVTRGQPNAPFPVYVLPYLKGIAGSQNQRKEGSRLGNFFLMPSPKSADNGIFVSEQGVTTAAASEVNINPDFTLIAEGSSVGELFVPAGKSYQSGLSADEILEQTAREIDITKEVETIVNNASGVSK